MHKIEIRSLYKSYQNGAASLEVLRGVELVIGNGEFLAIQGPSGAGKSTLLHIIGGLDSPDRGEVLFDGRDIYRFSDNARANFRNREIGFVFQFYHLLPELNVLENVVLPRLLLSWQRRKRAAEEARVILQRLGLDARLHHRPSQLSGGEQQRVAIARALINRPRVLFCDEPTGNLDSQNGQTILQLLHQLNREEKVTIILVTHDKDIAMVAHRFVHVKDGRIVH